MAGTGNGGDEDNGFGVDPIAAMAMAYETPLDDASDGASDEPDTTADDEAPSTEPEAGSDDGVVADDGVAAEAVDVTEDPTPEVVTDATSDETASQPYRSFATEAEYQTALGEATRRSSNAQSAIARELKTLQDAREAEREELETLQAFRNEIYHRMGREELTQEHLLEAYTRHNQIVKTGIATERTTAEAAAAERDRAEQQQAQATAGATAANEAGVLKQTNALLKELTPVEGFDVEAAHRKALERADVQRYAQLSHTAPDAETRAWARDEAYRLAKEVVNRQHGQAKSAFAKVAASRGAPKPKAQSFSAGAAQATSSPLAGITDRMEMLATAYTQG